MVMEWIIGGLILILVVWLYEAHIAELEAALREQEKRNGERKN